MCVYIYNIYILCVCIYIIYILCVYIYIIYILHNVCDVYVYTHSVYICVYTVFICVCVYRHTQTPCLLKSIICWSTFRLFHCLSNCKLCCYENWSACIFFKKHFIYLFILTVVGFCWWAGDWGLLSSCDTQATNCSGFSLCRAWALGHMGSSSCSLQCLVHRLSSCGTWNLPGSGIKPRSPTLAGGFFTTEPSGKPWSACICVSSLEKISI